MNKEIVLPKRLHVIGICGVATSALAIAFHKRGVKVTGSDKGFFPPVSIELEKQGISFYAGWHPEKMFGGENYNDSIIIVGTASGTANPEIIFAKEKNIPTYSYPEVIGKYFSKERSIVCVGTWGKTSSSAILSYILEQAGLDPSYMFGGISLSHDSSAKLTNSKWSVFEGDEYKSSPTDQKAKFFHYKATDLLLTAVSWDHADLYPTEREYFQAFEKLIATIPTNGTIVACLDRNDVKEIVKDFKGQITYYGRELPISQTLPQYFIYKNLSQTKKGISFSILHDGIEYKVNSPMLGLYQAENITGCFAMAFNLGIEPEKIINAIGRFKGLKRRMERRFEGTVLSTSDYKTTNPHDHNLVDSIGHLQDLVVIDDIAHSPEKAMSVLATLKSVYDSKLIAVFEPNSGGRSHESIAKYDNAFERADIVVIPRLTKLKIDEKASVQPMEGAELASAIAKTHQHVEYMDDDIKLVSYLISESKKGGIIAFLGSHGFRGMIEEVVERISRK